jgi:cellulose synthase/poly-beta-1,6-N-acetylglucosamine synthase-like glycosyltransferase
MNPVGAGPTLSEVLEVATRLLEALVVLYSLGYVGVNATLIALAYRPVVDRLRSRAFDDFDLMDERDSTLPPIAIVVPAYDEARIIVESVRSLMAVDYPALELVIVNDGSNDDTARELRRAFRMRRRDVPTRQDLSTAEVQSCYEAGPGLPAHVKRFLLVNKVNGGRADALNAGLNFCTSPFFLTVDADCIVEPHALKRITRLLQAHPDLAAVGGQIGVVNDCEVRDGRIVRARISRRWLPLCQTLEYLRAFSLMRAGFARLDALVILSGAFMVLRRELAVSVGGFLTGRSPSRLLREYVGPGGSTICEDMEMVVRIHRYARDRGRRAQVLHTPLPVVWTEVPEDTGALSKQRRRWHRGLLEILHLHRHMMLQPAYGRVGVFALPYFFWFELMGPYIEASGFVLVPLLALFGHLSLFHAVLLTSIALGAGMIQSLLAVCVSTLMLPASPAGDRVESMLGADRWRDRAVLFAGSFLTELGYRQLTVWWRLRGTWDYFRGHHGWDKFERKGYRTAATSAVLAALLLAASFSTAHAQAERPPWEASVVLTSERRDGQPASWWTESLAQRKAPRSLSQWTGVYRADRDGMSDYGMVVGLATPHLSWGGAGGELRISTGADFTPLWSTSAETEFGLWGHWTGSLRWRHAHYAALDVDRIAPGAVAYLHGEVWWSNHLVIQESRFDAGPRDRIVGWSSMLYTPLPWIRPIPHGVSVRWKFDRGGENYLVRASAPVGDLRATTYGAQLEVPVASTWRLLVGVDDRHPDRGSANRYWTVGVKTRFGSTREVEKPDGGN